MFLPADGIVVDLNPTVDTAATASGDVIFAPTEITNAVLNTKGLAYLRGLVVLDAANIKGAMDLMIFDRDPGDIAAINAPVVLSATQLSYLVGYIVVAAVDYVTITAAGNAVAPKTPNIFLPAKQGSKSFWIAGIGRASIDYVAATDLRIKLMLERQS